MNRKLLAPMLLAMCVAVAAVAQDSNVTVSTQDQDLEVVMVLPESDRTNARSLLLSMPPSERTMAVGLIRELRPEIATVVVRGLYNVNISPVTTPDPGDTFAEQQAFEVVAERLDSNDQPVFRTFWETDMTPAQKTTYLTLVRRAHFGGFRAEPSMTPPPVQDARPMQDTPPSMEGVRAQPMLDPMTSLPEPARAAFMRFEPDLDNAEKVAYARNLNQITPEQAEVVAIALANLNEMGKSGSMGERQKGINEDDAVRLMASTFESGDQGRFESAWNGISSELQFIFVTAARDAFRGGFGDPRPTTPAGTSSP